MRRTLETAALSIISLALWCAVVAPPRSASSAQPAAQRGAAREDVRAVVREATRAVETGSAAQLRARLEARLRADSGDRAAALGLATIDRLTYDYARAGLRYRRLIDGAAATDPYAIYARLGIAQGQDTQGRKQGQEELLTEARDGARTARDGAAEGEALLWQSLAFGPVYGGAYAIAKVDTALRVLPADVRDLQAVCRCRRAQVIGVMGLPGATDSVVAASEFARRTGETGGLAACLRAVGVYQWVRGFTDSALVTYDSLAALRRRTHDRSNLAVVLVLSGDALRGRGDIGRALPLFREALDEARASHNLYIEATVTLGLGGTALTLNDHATAATNVRRAIAAFEAADDSGSAMLARSYLPFVSLAAGDYPRARQEVQAVLPWAKNVGDWSHVVELYTQLAAIEMRARDWTSASRALDSARVVARRLGPSTEGLLHFPRGRLALYSGDLAAAEREFTRYLAGLDSLHRLERYETRAYLADVHARRGDLPRAARELTAAGDELDAWRSRLGDAEVRTLAFQAGATETNDRNASVARVLAALAAGGRADEAFALAERRRARELAERITRVHALRADDSSAVATRQSARPRRDAAAPASETTSAAAIAAAIPDDSTALLEFVTGVLDAPTTLLVVTRGAPVRAHVLPPADSLVDDIARFVALTEGGKDPGALARSLGATLLGPALPALPASVTRIVVVPDGPLHRVPWDALQLADGRYVAQRYATSVAPSATVLAGLWRRPRARSASGGERVRLLAYGDPAFAGERESGSADDAKGAADEFRSAFDSTGGLPRLRASADEARLVGRYADAADVRLREEASAAFLKHAALADYRVLHLATHALVDERSLARTALALAPGAGESGFVGAADLAALSLDADLVVLSACRSAGGVVVDGEGVQGLTAPLLEAGARSVVATTWRIGDRTTVAFVSDLYAALARGLPVGEALRAARLAAIARGAPPREWAAFVAVGDPLITVPLHAPRSGPSRLWLLAAAALLGAIALLAYWWRRRGDRTTAARVAISLVPFCLAAPSAGGQVAPDDPRAVVREATRAVQAGTPERLRASWQSRLRADSADRAATLGLATIARLTYDYPTAERLYERLLADSARPDRYVAIARYALARSLAGRGFGVRADPLFARAREEARAAGDAQTEGEVLLPLAFNRVRTDGVAAGEALLDTASRLIPDSAFDLRSQLHFRRAIVLSMRGSPQAAAEADSAIALGRRAEDPRLEGDGYSARGRVLVYTQQFDSALVALTRAEDLYRRAHDRSALAGHLVWHAQALGNLGRFGEMREVMRLAVTEGEASKNPASVAVAYRSLGALAIMMSDFATAGENLRRSEAISRQTGDSLGVLGTRKFLADVALASGDVAGARRIAFEQLAEARRMGDQRDQHEAHVMLFELALRERDWPAAERSLADARAAIQNFPGTDYRLWLLHHEGRLAQARGDLRAAERAFTAFLGAFDESKFGESRFDTHARLADIRAARGDLAGAERELATASDQLDRWRASLGDAELRVLAFQVSPSQHAGAADPHEQDARVARVLGALAAGGRTEAAFELAERQRARELSDRLVRAAGLRTGTGAGVSRHAATGAADSAASLKAATLAARIPDERTALLEFVGGVDGAPTTLFVVRRGGLRAFTLQAADSLGDRVARLTALVESGANSDAAARALGATLLDSALATLGGEVARLIVVPDGSLHFVPWDALRLADGHYVAERYAVSVAPSSAVLAALWGRAAERAARGARPVRLLAFGDPSFADERDAPASPDAESYRSAFDSTGGLPRLRASADEARLVGRYADAADVRLREEASAAFLKHAGLADYRVLHLATHALVDERSLARTALALAPGAGESGFVGAADLAALSLDADLVVLSACRSAGGVVVDGEGVQGLTAPLLEAGARSVVATGWKIGDRSTVSFVGDFYAAMARGLPVGDALREAKLAAIRRGAPPREWAAFMAVGDPLVTVPLHAPPPAGPGLRAIAAAIALGAAALVALAVYGARRRRGRTAEAR